MVQNVSSPALPGAPVGARTITPGSMEPGDHVTTLDGSRSFTVEKVRPMTIYYGRLMVEVWWIKGYEQAHTIKTVCIPRQQFYLLRR